MIMQFNNLKVVITQNVVMIVLYLSESHVPPLSLCSTVIVLTHNPWCSIPLTELDPLLFVIS